MCLYINIVLVFFNVELVKKTVFILILNEPISNKRCLELYLVFNKY